MKTQDIIAILPENHLSYLENLKATRRRAKAEGHTTLFEQTNATGRGYIKALENCGVIPSGGFRALWCWFTV